MKLLSHFAQMFSRSTHSYQPHKAVKPAEFTISRTFTLFALGLLIALQTVGAQAQETAAHAVHISIDALGGKYLEKFLSESPDEFKNFKRFIDEGATTLNARTDYFRTNTLPNHTCMVTGRPVRTPENWQEAAGHHWQKNGVPKEEESLHDMNPAKGYTSSTFDVAHDNGLTTALYSTKSKFVIYSQTYGDKFGADHANGKNKIDHAKTGGKSLHEIAMKGLKEHQPNYTFLHYGQPDGAGHRHGYLGDEYRDAVKLVDGFLGDLFNLIDTDPEWTNRTVIILSADHGGQPGTKGHGKSDEPYNYTLPFLVWGTGVAKGADLYELNTTSRTNPGEGRPEYAPTGQPIRNGDGGNLALKLLGLPAIPGSSINNKQDLNVR